ncbi:uncharacterized protein LACBIDRAFT_325295 [Laccaria bicolor S238N-H82]|uniref:Predicted protein n=1 Tax=Laccaria bicolor (strain S238N-H82 / ATCC MYA-4686) TaxID=486041 RepID=B0D4G2_LACBS|nr:uncharacterized protein LACBIDRAFT_325295 [Laccaria bicolor S238N-H82]EDR10339.1 predicted protein [Laccaria bicolor S238N-H82]|eukprot:XP_001878789.1 predicted protein [Laccaria bicolor S238N-H82]
MTPSAGFSLIRRPKLDPDAGPPKTAMAALRQAKTAERLANQNAAIAKGNYQLADIPCEACSKRQDRDIVPCAIRSPPQQGSCFTCSTGKTTCTYAVTKKKDTDSEVEDEIQKGLQDLETAAVSGGDAQVKIKLRDQQAQVSVMESSTPTMREYSAFVVRKQDIDASALLPPAVDSPVTLSQRLLALEEITRCIQDQDLASRPLSEKIASLETSVWFQEEKITGATRRMDRIEESAHMRWKETQEDLQSIRSDHQRLEAEVREAVKTLENKWETTPAALQESLTRGFEKLASRIETAELTLHDLTKSVTTISELNLRLGARQSSLESLIIQFLGNKEKKHTGINTDRSVSPDRGQKSQQVQVSPTPGVVLPNPVSTDHAQVSPTPAVFLPPASESPAVLLLAPNPIPPTRASSPGPYIGGNRKSPRLQKLEPTLQTPAQITNNDVQTVQTPST